MTSNLESYITETVNKNSPNLKPGERKMLSESLQKMFLEGVPLKESLKISDNTLELMYTMGFQEFQKGNFKEALKYFTALNYLHPQDVRFPQGVAVVHHKMKDFENAFAWYLLAAMIDRETPMPYYYSSDCVLQMGDKEGAIILLEKAEKRCGSNSAYGPLKARIQMTVATYKKELAAETKKEGKTK